MLLALLLATLQQQPTAFVDVTVVPMDRERLLPHWTVVVTNGRISSYGANADVKIPAGARRVDGKGKYLIPGLTEMHAHVPPGRATDEEISRMLELWALNGVTTVRSMLGIPRHLYFRDLAAKREILSPRIVASGPSFSAASVPSPDSAVRMVLAEKALGYDFLKIHPGLTRAMFDSMAATADRVGIRFSGHVPLAVGLRRAIEARYATIDHLDGFVEAMATGDPVLTNEQDGFFGLAAFDRVDESRLADLVAAMKTAGVSVVPTEKFFESMAGDTPVDQLLAGPEMKYVAEPMVRSWGTATNNLRNDPNNPVEKRQKFIALRRRIIKALFDAGVPILLGSDSPQIWNAPGFSLSHELETYVAAGLTPWQALATGTRNTAVFFGWLDDGGTVGTGRRADLILLDGNPLDDIRNVSKRAGVMVNGRWLDKAEIDRRLAALARP